MSDAALHFAEEYIQRGYSIIPLIGKVPPTGFRWAEYQQRRTTLFEIQTWFGPPGARRYNLGIVTGHISGITVVDIDSPEDLDWWTANFPQTPLVANTGRGGAHMYYRACPETVGNRAGILGRQIDVRSTGGYVVAPPSVHDETGKGYTWRSWKRYCMDQIPLFDPTWLESDATSAVATPRARSERPRIRNGPAYISHVYAISGQGGHNATFRAACALRDAGLTPDAALKALTVWNETNCRPKWSMRDLEHKIRDAYRVNSP